MVNPFKILSSMLGRKAPPAAPAAVDVTALDPFPHTGYVQHSHGVFTGDKFPGGFGSTELYQLDYWTLRERSSQLFTENLYARGLIRRLVTNEINTGLTPEAAPDEQILGVDADMLLDWTEAVENRFDIWGRNPRVCDYRGWKSYGANQRQARMEALVAGDVLVVLRQSPIYRVPQVQLINGGAIRTPLQERPPMPVGHEIKHGVEFDTEKNVVAYWVRNDEGVFDRLPAYGPRTGRRVAWLVFGTEKRLDECRGMPLLGIMLQSLKEIDRYRDSAQRKAVVNSILAMFIKKGEDKVGSLPVQGGAVRRNAVEVEDGDGKTRTFDIANMIPGVVMEELQQGEEPVGFHSQGTDIDFAKFEEAIIQAIAWANEIPPEILTLAFSNNYSASQAAINEFKIYLNRIWTEWGEAFCTPIYIEWLLSEVLAGRIEAPGFLDAWRDPAAWDTFGAWTAVDWYGSIKPSTDMLKQAKGSKMLVDEGWSTNARESRINTGTKFEKNIKRLRRENEQKVEAMRPVAEFRSQFGTDPEAESAPEPQEPEDTAAGPIGIVAEQVADAVDEYLESRGVGDG